MATPCPGPLPTAPHDAGQGPYAKARGLRVGMKPAIGTPITPQGSSALRRNRMEGSTLSGGVSLPFRKLEPLSRVPVKRDSLGELV